MAQLDKDVAATEARQNLELVKVQKGLELQETVVGLLKDSLSKRDKELSEVSDKAREMQTSMQQHSAAIQQTQIQLTILEQQQSHNLQELERKVNARQLQNEGEQLKRDEIRSIAEELVKEHANKANSKHEQEIQSHLDVEQMQHTRIDHLKTELEQRVQGNAGLDKEMQEFLKQAENRFQVLTDEVHSALHGFEEQIRALQTTFDVSLRELGESFANSEKENWEWRAVSDEKAQNFDQRLTHLEQRQGENERQREEETPVRQQVATLQRQTVDQASQARVPEETTETSEVIQEVEVNNAQLIPGRVLSIHITEKELQAKAVHKAPTGDEGAGNPLPKNSQAESVVLQCIDNRLNPDHPTLDKTPKLQAYNQGNQSKILEMSVGDRKFISGLFLGWCSKVLESSQCDARAGPDGTSVTMVRLIFTGGVILRAYLKHDSFLGCESFNREPEVVLENAYAASDIPDHEMEDIENSQILLLVKGEPYQKLVLLKKKYHEYCRVAKKGKREFASEKYAKALDGDLLNEVMGQILIAQIGFTEDKPHLKGGKVVRRISEKEAKKVNAGVDEESTEYRYRIDHNDTLPNFFWNPVVSEFTPEEQKRNVGYGIYTLEDQGVYLGKVFTGPYTWLSEYPAQHKAHLAEKIKDAEDVIANAKGENANKVKCPWCNKFCEDFTKLGQHLQASFLAEAKKYKLNDAKREHDPRVLTLWPKAISAEQAKAS